ncbi:class II fructose-bisphosphatase [Patescibacteria group bacterium]|nr:class II fructose-bisphosphatase [Patescibacteria group bacterium]
MTVFKSFDAVKFRNLEGKLLYVTQMAAISAARAAGHGDKKAADRAAVNAMREYLGKIEGTRTTVQIGEGVRDKAPMLYIGEEIGTGTFQIDLAVDPLENTNATAKLGPNAICVLAASEPGGLINATDGYMNKLVVGPKVAGKINIENTVEANISIIAAALNRDVEDLTITVLDRERNKDLITKIIRTGARAQVIPDGDLIPGILTCISGSSTHALMGIGASPEGVITATAVKMLGGEMQAKFYPKDEEDMKQLVSLGVNVEKVYTHDDLASGEYLIFCVTAVTALSTATRHILDGVSFFGGAAKTNSMLITARTLETISTTHILNKSEFDRSRSEFRL